MLKAYHRYLVKNWDKKIADHIIAEEIKGEAFYGIHSTGTDRLQQLKKNGIDIRHANIYMPAPYDMLHEFFTEGKVARCKHLMDLGCGKGRVLCVAAFAGVKKLSGIDFSRPLIDAATENIGIIKKQFPQTKFFLYCNDAFYFTIEKDVDCLFLFNPFDDIILSGVLENLEESLLKKPRTMTVIYFNPVDQKMFLDYGYKVIYHSKKMEYLEGVILQK